MDRDTSAAEAEAIARMIEKQVLPLTDASGVTSGLWLFGSQWRIVLAALRTTTQAETADPADELEATIKTERVANVRYYYSMETFAVTLRDGRQGQGSTIRAAIDSANQRKA